MIEHAAPAGVFFTGDVDTGLLIKPPVGKSEVIGNVAGLLQDDSVWDEHGIDITSHASGVVSQCHSGTAHDEHVRHDASAGQALPEGREGSLDLCPVEENVTRLGHAASRSLAGRYTPCLRNAAGRPDQRIGSLDLKFRREPRPMKYSYLGPFRRCSIVLGGQILSKRGQEHVPSLVTSGGRFVV
jgi:hypothetical protein